MASELTLKISNSSSQAWHCALYQDRSLDTMAWLVPAVSKPDPDPTTASVSWTMTYQVTIAVNKGGLYLPGTSLDAKDGYKYEVVPGKKGALVINEVGVGMSGHIVFKNRTPDTQNLGLVVNESVLAMKQVVGGYDLEVDFELSSIYSFGLYNTLEQGQVLPASPDVGPVSIQFPSGMNTVTISADDKGLSKPSYS